MLVKVAFQGEVGAYSEEAAFNFLGNSIQTIPCKNLSDVFKAVEQSRVNFGIVPVENSLEGSIGQTYDLLLHSRLKISGETAWRIRHCLIVSPGIKISQIKKIFSHPQALGQCRKFLEKYQWETIPTYDTAGSVKMLKEKRLKNAAAIASARAAKVYGMEILKRGIETNHQNFTRFFVISKEDKKPSGQDKTSIVFRAKHRPGALFELLREFASSKINLAKIESRPIVGRPWEYSFYLDFEGYQKETRIKRALNNIKKLSTFLKILGSYPKMKNAH